MTEAVGEGGGNVPPKVDLPDNSQRDPELFQPSDLPPPSGFVSPLRAVKEPLVVDAGISVPVGPVDFEGATDSGEIEVEDADVAAIPPPDWDLPDELDAAAAEDLGDAVFEAADGDEVQSELSLEAVIGTVIEGDCIEVMRRLPANSIDAVVTDPPYDLLQASRGGSGRSNNPDTPGGRHGAKAGGFMGLSWDATGIAFRPETWAEVLRVAKPGAFLLAFGGTRTVHRMTTAIEDAGWEIRDLCVWGYNSGFPKSRNIGKDVDRLMGVESEVVGTKNQRDIRRQPGRPMGWGIDVSLREGPEYIDLPLTVPTSDQGKQWAGFGTALKPAWEPIVMARKPLSEPSVAANVIKHGAGALNIDATRIPLNPGEEYVINTFDDGAKPFGGGAGHEYTSRTVARGREGEPTAEKRYTEEGSTNFAATPGPRGGDEKGRWPANVMLTDPIFDGGYEGVVGGGERSSGVMKGGTERNSRSVDYGLMPTVATLDDTYGDSGGISRFYLVPKAARSEREPNWHGLAEFEESDETNTVGPMAGRGQAGLRCLKCGHWKVSGNPCVCAEPEWEQTKFNRPKVFNNHATVKPLDLLCHLVRLACPPGAVVLDPFLGSGTTAKAADLEGRRWVGIEKDAHHVKISRARLEATQQGMGLD